MRRSRSVPRIKPSIDVLAEEWIALADAATLLNRAVSTTWEMCRAHELTWRQDKPGAKIFVAKSSVRAHIERTVREASA